MNIKAQGLLNAAEYIRERYGRDTLAEVLRECSPQVRDRYTSVLAISWHPMEEFCEFVETAERVVGSENGRVAEDIGAAGARANMKGVLLRAAFYLGKPEYLMTRVAGLWRQFNDEGTMVVDEMTDHSVRLEVKGVGTPRGSFCSVLTGWCVETTLALGVKRPRAQHVLCRARGDGRCVWTVRGRLSVKPPAG